MNFRQRRNESPELTLTPMIDVVFLLLIFFMVTTTFVRETAMEVQLPEAAAGDEVEREAPPTVVVRADGSYRIGDEDVPAASEELLKQAVEALVSGRDDEGLYVVADAEAPHQAVVRAMDVARDLGISRLSVATRHPDDG